MMFKNTSSHQETAASLHEEVDVVCLEDTTTSPVEKLLPVPSEDPNDPLVGRMLPS
jgi:hypothetical protein